MIVDKRTWPDSEEDNGFPANDHRMMEREIKHILEKFLACNGWSPIIVWGINHRIDVEATNGQRKWIIEVISPEMPGEPPIDHFISVLGKIIQRMDNPHYKYSIALPDTQPFRKLWKRLPELAKSRVCITALFVNSSGLVDEQSI